MLDDLHVEDHIEAGTRCRASLRRLRPGSRSRAPARRHERWQSRYCVSEGSIPVTPRRASPWARTAGRRRSRYREGSGRERARCEGVAAKAGGDLLADIGEPDRIELVQDGEFAARVPPFGGELREFLDFGRVETWHGFGRSSGLRGCSLPLLHRWTRSSMSTPRWRTVVQSQQARGVAPGNRRRGMKG